MSHRIIIARAVATATADPVVREQMTTEQCTCVDAILQNEEPSVNDFHDVLHVLYKTYKKPD